MQTEFFHLSSYFYLVLILNAEINLSTSIIVLQKVSATNFVKKTTKTKVPHYEVEQVLICSHTPCTVTESLVSTVG